MGPSREACDRCHAMKTRCVRAHHSRVCMRCGRLGISCNHSPPGRTGRPLGSRRARAATNKERGTTEVVGNTAPAIYPDTASSDDQINISDWCSTSCLEDIGFLTSQPCSDTDSIALSFPDNLFSTCPPSLTNSTTTGSPSESPLTFRPLDDQAMADPSASRFNASSLEIIPLLDNDDDFSDRLSDVQVRLTKLVRSLCRGSKAADDVEEIYRASEAVIGILDNTSQPLHGPPASLRPDGVAILLLSGCYLSLMKAYQSLVEMLHQELRESSDPSSQGGNPSGSLGNDSYACTKGIVPYLSIGAVRLAMPRKAIAEINLHLVSQKVQHLKISMGHYASRVAAARSTQATNLESQRRGSCDSIETGDISTLTDLVESALVEIRVREDELLEKDLRTLPFSVENSTNDAK